MAYFNWNDSEIWDTFFIFFAKKGGFSRPPPLTPLGENHVKVGSMLGHCLWSRPDINPALDEYLVFSMRAQRLADTCRRDLRWDADDAVHMRTMIQNSITKRVTCSMERNM